MDCNTTAINYPDHPENNVKYHYGGIHSSYNRIGRLMLREDGSGAVEYYYGKMGEVLKTVRTLIVPNQAVATYVTQWKYDSHNRLLEMIYPDEEKVTYGYNLGGQVDHVRGYKSYGYDYVSKIGYDKFEQRTYLKYCNGAETFYTYDPARRRLQNLVVNAKAGTIMDNAYICDADSYEKMQFYYHPDHLGSSSYITNLDGKVAQHIEYVPFGEVFIEERNNTWNTPYLFNAKEFDEETGMYYYGARYYEPRLSLWMSVDPLEEKYPSITSYCYTYNNPVKFVDPDGQKIVLVGTYKEKMKTLSNLQKLTNDNLIMNRATGVITIGKRRWSNRNSNFSAGTKLIQSIVNSRRTVEIEINSNGDNKSHSIYRQNAYKGTGTDVRITYDPSQKHSPEILVANSKDGKSIYEASPVIMNLDHELVHAERAIYGRQASDGSNGKEEALGQYLVTKPNGVSYKITDELEELQATGKKSTFINSKRAASGKSEFNENILRREHGYNERIEY